MHHWAECLIRDPFGNRQEDVVHDVPVVYIVSVWMPTVFVPQNKTHLRCDLEVLFVASFSVEDVIKALLHRLPVHGRVRGVLYLLSLVPVCFVVRAGGAGGFEVSNCRGWGYKSRKHTRTPP